MAIAWAGERAAGTSAATSPVSIVLASSCSAASRVVLMLGGRATATPAVVVTDSRGNTWTVEAGPVREPGNAWGFIASTRQDAGTLQAGDTITVTITGGTPTVPMFWVQEITGAAVAAFDQQATSTGSNSPTSVGPSGVTAQADELVVNLFPSDDNATFSVGAGYSPFTTTTLNNGGKSAGVQFKTVAAIGAQSGTMTFAGVAQGWAGLLATYKDASAAAPSGRAPWASGWRAAWGTWRSRDDDGGAGLP